MHHTKESLKELLSRSGFLAVSYMDFCGKLWSHKHIIKKVTEVRDNLFNGVPVVFIDWEHEKTLMHKEFQFVGFSKILGRYHDRGPWALSVPAHGKSRWSGKDVPNLEFLIYVNNHNEEFDANKIDHSNKKKDFLYLNGKAHPHRVELLKKMLDKKLLNNSVWSASSPTQSWGEMEKILEDKYEWSAWRGRSVDGYDASTRHVHFLQYNDTVCSVVPETMIDNGYHYITEKTCKPLMAEHIFVVLAGSGYLKHLRTLGFKTFSDYFDEGYDDCEDLQKRIDLIANTLESIKNMDPHKLYKDTEQVRKHNRELFFDEKFYTEFNNQQLDKFKKLFEI